MTTKELNSLLIILISQLSEYPWLDILFNSIGDPIDFQEDINRALQQNREINLILNTDDLILNAYPKEETEEEPTLTWEMNQITFRVFID